MNLRVNALVAGLAMLAFYGPLTTPGWSQPTVQAPEAAEATAKAPATSPPALPIGLKEKETDTSKKESERLASEAELRSRKLAAELAGLKEENERLKLAYETAVQRQRNELLMLEMEKAKLGAEMAVAQAKREQANSQIRMETEDLQSQQQIRDLKLTAELAESKAALQKTEARRLLDEAKAKAALAELDRQRAQIAAQTALEVEKQRALELAQEAETRRLKGELGNAQMRLQIFDSHEQYRQLVNEEIEYRKEPLVDGVLHISDRRIALDGPIIAGSADYVTDRIAYFNNQSSDYPIFIVINNSPGGSVLQGYRIVKAMQASKAPVYVVVKSFAASMAACIATLAQRSYAYPNAIILHHQMSSMMLGNMSMIEEEVERLKEWQRRLAEPVARKMGITIEEFVERMYKKSKSTGDWEEFADQAVELKWVDVVVNEIREEGIRKRPTGDLTKPWFATMMGQDAQGKPYCQLPVLEPGDAYFMYNPRGFYR